QGPEHNAPGSGGYAIRPYAPAPVFLVGADAHIGPPGCVSEPPSPAAPAAIPAVGAHCICALPSRRNHQGPEHNAPSSGGYAIRPYAPAPGFLVGAACMAA